MYLYFQDYSRIIITIIIIITFIIIIIIIINLLTYLLNAIEFSLGGSSPYTSTGKTNNKCT